MDPKKVAEAANPEQLAEYIARLPPPHHHGHGEDDAVETVREDDYQGRHIVIRTRYRIEVDGKAFAAPMTLDNAGQVHCHSLPNYQFASAVDMVKRLIDIFPDDFPEPPKPGGRSPSKRRTRKSKGG